MIGKIFLVYVPVLHDGYRQFFGRNPFISDLYILGSMLASKFDPLRKDIRALSPELVKAAIESWNIFRWVRIAEEETLRQINRDRRKVCMPKEDVCFQLAEEYLRDCEVEFIPVFLRWDRTRALAQTEVPCDETVEADEFVSQVFSLAKSEAMKSPDWWRQIGAVAVKDGKIIFTAFNQHVPSPNHVWAFGDPRANFIKGVHFELSPGLHAEVAIVAEAARKGLSFEGVDFYTTTFPCPPCARVLAYSGIKNLFFLEGYSVYDGIDVLRSRGVKIIRVRM